MGGRTGFGAHEAIEEVLCRGRAGHDAGAEPCEQAATGQNGKRRRRQAAVGA
ncbi:hypothetical protein BV133_499 [Blastochloris viridis]|uniref:Uncharacterized protein n=1 Tax=Blastochloris viridis TaxID=1079 RepID=A0A182CZZ8_BLAVI|nr:hypothetical protein BV133_499 [Blastochloris viridis]